jgi:hypothetical protein
MHFSLSSCRVFALLASFLSIQGCKLKTNDSKSLHDFGKPAADGSVPPMWVETTVEIFKSQRLKGESVFPANHPKTARLQAWADELHKQVLSISSGTVAPKPLIAIVQRDKLNAFVTAMPLCVPVTITSKSKSKQRTDNDSESESPRRLALNLNASPDEGAIDVDTFDGSLREALKEDYKCQVASKSTDQIRQVLDFALGSKKSCVTYDSDSKQSAGNPHITLDTDCLAQQGVYINRGFSASTLIYKAVPNVITFYDGIFNLTEEETVYVLAHELGHYYRLHPVLPKGFYNFFYKLDQSHNLASKPAPLPDSDVTAVFGKDVVKNARHYLQLAKVPQQKLSTYFFKVIQDFPSALERLCGDEKGCTNACAAIRQHFDKSEVEFDSLLGYFPSSRLPGTSEAQTFYKDYEQKVESCFKAMSLAKEDKASFIQWLKSGDLENITEDSLGSSAHHAWDAVQELNGKIPELIKVQNDKIGKIITKANQERLGYYTDEQEADEIAVELTSRIGVDPKYSATSFLKLLQDYEKLVGAPSSLPGTLSYKQCLESYNKGFPDFVPIADYADSHHSACYRIYNNFREQKAHQAELKALPKYQGAVKIDSKLWKTLQKKS